MLVEIAMRSFKESDSSDVPPLFVTLAASELSSDVRERLFTSRPGSILSPFPFQGQYALSEILAIQDAILDGETRDTIERLLFQEWLADQRSQAHVEWNWGPA